ncbi:uncharacterized protein LOC123010225 [Tribolium madens]|uniref:uncharacterized protein LOC123010225 n=1 Tax=Tribolium madens TaxID=41895 RepID=UPI001CF75915|nr:uncharacterized protein LOC123010225 [Tribolium madens]
MRNYKRTSQRAATPPHIMLRAAREVKLNQKSIRGTAKDFDIPEASLRRFCRNVTDEEIQGQAENLKTEIGYKSPSNEQEKLLEEYILQAADIYNGLSPREIRAFEYCLES